MIIFMPYVVMIRTMKVLCLAALTVCKVAEANNLILYWQCPKQNDQLTLCCKLEGPGQVNHIYVINYNKYSQNDCRAFYAPRQAGSLKMGQYMNSDSCNVNTKVWVANYRAVAQTYVDAGYNTFVRLHSTTSNKSWCYNKGQPASHIMSCKKHYFQCCYHQKSKKHLYIPYEHEVGGCSRYSYEGYEKPFELSHGCRKNTKIINEIGSSHIIVDETFSESAKDLNEFCQEKS